MGMRGGLFTPPPPPMHTRTHTRTHARTRHPRAAAPVFLLHDVFTLPQPFTPAAATALAGAQAAAAEAPASSAAPALAGPTGAQAEGDATGAQAEGDATGAQAEGDTLPLGFDFILDVQVQIRHTHSCT
jgi:hypothetical protein